VVVTLLVVVCHKASTYDHINTPYYKVVLTSSYEDGLEGVHLRNKKEQDRAMNEFVAGRLGAGEMGNGIQLDKMVKTQKKLQDKMWKQHGFDEYISELVSLNRSLPDRRDDWCKKPSSVGVLPADLPPTSIIVIFHNEAWSTLMRTIYSVINRSPDYLLVEIILVDDASTMEHLGQKLQDAVDAMDKVKLVRQKVREGLMRTRITGVKAAKAKVVTFLDSHIEATEGWLEPLLERVALNPKAVACPVIEEVNDKTFQYKFVTRDLEGVFYWNLDFGWKEVFQTNWAPYESAAMAGGLFTIDKDWFEHLGFYDEGMEVWGGENLELSFKVWMCGGIIEIVPCSRVGHIFRSFSPYKWRTDLKIPEYNYIRVADTWMDDYKYLYFDRLGNTGKSIQENLGNYGDVSSRKELREKLECKNFDWYLKNKLSSLGDTFIIGSGEIRNTHHQFCLDQQDRDENVGLEVLVFDCHGEKGNQYWYYRSDGRITRDFLCIGKKPSISKNTNDIELVPCDTDDIWAYNPQTGQLQHAPSGSCLRVTRSPLQLYLETCRPGATEQQWWFTNYDESGWHSNSEEEDYDTIDLDDDTLDLEEEVLDDKDNYRIEL